MKRIHNILLMIAVVVLAVVPLLIVQKPAAGPDGKAIEIFAGSDDKAKDLIGEINPEYTPWFESIMEPASGEIASLLFALQAAIGAGFIGYYLGAGATREKMRREFERQKHAQKGPQSGAD